MERRWSGRATADVTRSHQMTGHGAKFGRKQEEAIAALLSHRSIDDAAQAIHIAPRTLLRWLQLVEFNAAYRKPRRAAVSQSVARLQQVRSSTPARTRARAADSVLDHSSKTIALEEL